MNFHDFPINQSIIRKFLHNGEERSYCFRRIYLTKIAKTHEEAVSDPMNHGKYFETKALGRSAKGDALHDLPRKKLVKAQLAENAARKERKEKPLKGDKYLHHIRIDEQVMRFHALVSKYKVMVNQYNVQVPLFAVWDQDPDVMLKAELDIFPTTIKLDNELEAAIIDLKLTADIHNTYGEYSYGAPEYLDLIQAKMYHYMVRNINEKLNPGIDKLLTDSIKSLIANNNMLFLLWIFNYKKDVLEDKFIKVHWDQAKEQELHESIRKTIAILEHGEANKWPTNPEYTICKNCPWKECPDRAQVQTI